MPGYVTKISTKGSSRLVDVKPLLRATQVDGSQAEYDIIQGVLLLTPGTTKSSIIMPINVNDLVLLVFSEKALENWNLSTQPANGIYGRQFDLSDAFAIPMNFGAMNTGENANNADMIIKHNGQTITIKNSGEIDLGSGTVQAVMTEAFKTSLGLYLTAIHTFVNSCAASTTDPTLAAAAGVYLGAFPSGFSAPSNGLTSKGKIQ